MEHTGENEGKKIADWEAGTELLNRYLNHVRINQRVSHALCGIVVAGRYRRFLHLESSQKECVDYPDTHSKECELADNEIEIDAILSELAGTPPIKYT